MKIILSRKGFDSEYGGHSSIIYPDGEMLSFPIPIDSSEKGISSSKLFFKEKSLNEIFKQLKIKNFQNLHLDPDIRYDICKDRDSTYKGSFGQIGSALGHLKENKIDKGDLFLFYGTFNFTKIIDEKINYDKSHSFHSIWGYLYIDEVIEDLTLIKNREDLQFLQTHMHYINKDNLKYKKNAIYIGKNFGVFNYSEELRLTKEGFQKSYWSLPIFFQKIQLTYHKFNDYEIDVKNNDKCNLQTVPRGQEFIFDSNDDVEVWINKLIKNKIK